MPRLFEVAREELAAASWGPPASAGPTTAELEGCAGIADCSAVASGACTASASVTTRPQARGAVDRRKIIDFPALIRVGRRELHEGDMGCPLQAYRTGHSDV